MLYDITSSAVREDNPKYVDALTLSPLGGFSQEQFENDNQALQNSLMNEFESAKSGGLEKTKDFINKYSQNFTKNFQIIKVDDTAANKLLKGEFKDYSELFNASVNSSQEPKNAVIIEYNQDKAIIQAVFLDIATSKK